MSKCVPCTLDAASFDRVVSGSRSANWRPARETGKKKKRKKEREKKKDFKKNQKKSRDRLHIVS